MSGKRASLQTTSTPHPTPPSMANTLHHHSTSPAWILETTWLAWWPLMLTGMGIADPHRPMDISSSTNFIRMIITGTISSTPRVRKSPQPHRFLYCTNPCPDTTPYLSLSAQTVAARISPSPAHTIPTPIPYPSQNHPQNSLLPHPHPTQPPMVKSQAPY